MNPTYWTPPGLSSTSIWPFSHVCYSCHMAAAFLIDISTIQNIICLKCITLQQNLNSERLSEWEKNPLVSQNNPILFLIYFLPHLHVSLQIELLAWKKKSRNENGWNPGSWELLLMDTQEVKVEHLRNHIVNSLILILRRNMSFW